MIRLESSINFGFKLSTWKLKENETFFFLRDQTWKSQSGQFLFGNGGGRGEIQGNCEEAGPELWKCESRRGVLTLGAQ